MNMNKALQNLYHAVSNETTTKVNISKLLVDIHYAITGKESPNKNNWSKIINSMADNWPEGGGGSSDFSTATVTIVNNDAYVTTDGIAAGRIYDLSPEWDLPPATLPICTGTNYFSIAPYESATYLVCLYKGHTILSVLGNINVSGDAELIDSENGIYDITGDCTITMS